VLYFLSLTFERRLGTLPIRGVVCVSGRSGGNSDLRRFLSPGPFNRARIRFDEITHVLSKRLFGSLGLFGSSITQFRFDADMENAVFDFHDRLSSSGISGCQYIR
jgi:hypothetical protein